MISWDTPPNKPILENNHIHVWLGCPEITGNAVHLYESILAPGEIERSGRFLGARDRNFYIIGRGILRRLLGGYLNQDPASLILKTNHQGKPSLDNGRSKSCLHFNISHSNGLVLMAFSETTKLGVDVEYIHRERNLLEVAKRYLSAGEALELQSIPQEKEKSSSINVG